MTRTALPYLLPLAAVAGGVYLQLAVAELIAVLAVAGLISGLVAPATTRRE